MDNTSKIYVDLESLLDLRQSALYYLTEDYTELQKYLLSEEYNFRTSDNFSIVLNGDFKELYSKKEKRLLEASSVTYILSLLRTKIQNLEKKNVYHSETKTPEIILNVHPFVLSQEECDCIRNLLFVKLNTNITISVVNLNVKELSPLFFNGADVAAAFIYNISSWGDNHLSSLVSLEKNNTSYYFPSIMYNTLTEEEEKEIRRLGFNDIFSYTEFLFSKIANITFLPSVFYSNIITAIGYTEEFNKGIENEIGDLSKEKELDDGDSSAKI